MTKPLHITPKLLLSIAVTLFTLLGIEIAFRVKAKIDDVRLYRAMQELKQPSVAVEGREVKLRHILRMSSNPRIIYELIPNLSVNFMRPLTTNSDEFRGPSYPTVKRGGTVRIVGLGDSGMFGWGVEDGEYYLAYLSDSLNTGSPEVSWEIINTAVPGYNTVMEVETLADKGLRYEPDLVILEFVGNDLDLPNFIRKNENYFSLKKSFLLEFVSLRLQGKGKGFEDILL